MRDVHRPIAPDVWYRAVGGHNVPPNATIGSVVERAGGVDRTVVLVFLRHYG